MSTVSPPPLSSPTESFHNKWHEYYKNVTLFSKTRPVKFPEFRRN